MPLQERNITQDVWTSNYLPPEAVIFGSSESMQALRRKLNKVASAKVPVVIEGENGCGKEVLARFIHLKSPWASSPFLKVSCPSIPGMLVESRLFGFENVPCGNNGDESSQHGTLFLDEVSELDFQLQSRLLELLQDGQLCHIGSSPEEPRSVRVICATSQSLDEAILSGRFRRDLLYRINVATVRVPPLRERTSDIPVLVRHFLEVFNQANGNQAALPSPQVMRLFANYSWPGNVRELKNLMERYVLFGSEDAIRGELQAAEARHISEQVPLYGQISLKKLTKNAVRDLERQVIAQVLQANHWNRKRAAQALNISYRALLYKLKDAGLAPHTQGGHTAERPAH